MDFTLNRYEDLLQSCLNAHKNIMLMGVFMGENQDKNHSIVLRHDVDRRAKNALAMACLEAKYGIKSTYYFRIPHTFKPNIIEEIAGLGHEIGFHYENLSKAKGNYEKAYEQFQQELAQLRNIAEVSTICMHGSPLSPYDNSDLWKKFDFTHLGILGEPYLSLDYSQIIYLTDTGRSWSGDGANLRDKVNARHASTPVLSSTQQLMHFIQSNEDPLIIQTHPERWSYSWQSFLISYGSDIAANAIKRCLKKVRGG